MKTLLSLCIAAFVAISLGAQAASPSQITFKDKKKTWLGTVYKVYDVRCSDSRKGTISYWNQKRPWCLGTSTKECYTTQIAAGNEVCK